MLPAGIRPKKLETGVEAYTWSQTFTATLFTTCVQLFATPWDYPGKNIAVGCHSLLQGIFPTQELKLYPQWLLADSLPLSNWKAHYSQQPQRKQPKYPSSISYNGVLFSHKKERKY